MQLASSAYFAVGGAIHDIGSAIAGSGSTTMRLLVLASQVFANIGQDPYVDGLQRHALLACRLAARIAGSKSPAATAALLANIGLTIPRAARREYRQDAARRPHPATCRGRRLPVGAVGPADRYRQCGGATPRPGPRRPRLGDAGIVHVSVALADGREPDGTT